jgi:hypothetical protein
MNNLVKLGLIGGAVYLLSQSKSKGETISFEPIDPTDLPETTQQQTEPTGGGTFMNGFKEDFEKPIPAEWRAKDWYAYINFLSASGMDKVAAIDFAWNQFNIPTNPILEYIPNKLAFIVRVGQGERIEPMYKVEVAGISGFVINWDSQPIYDTFDNSWSGVEAWSCQDWITWHTKLEQHYNNTQLANQAWLSAWQASDNQCWFLGQIGCPDTSYCRYDCENFVEYLASKGIDIGNLISNVSCDLSNVVLNLTSGTVQLSKGLNLAMTLLPFAAAYVGYRYLKKRKLI